MEIYQTIYQNINEYEQIFEEKESDKLLKKKISKPNESLSYKNKSTKERNRERARKSRENKK